MWSEVLATTTGSAHMRTEYRITRWRDVATLLEQGWTVDGFDLVSPSGERRSAWGNAIAACRKRGLVQAPGAALRQR